MAGIRAEVDLSVNTTQAQRSMQKAGDQLNKVMGGMSGKGVNFKINERSFTQPLGRITGSANEFSKSLEASNARVIAFGASVGILNGISNAFKNLVSETVKFEKTLADVNVVLNASNSSLEAFGSNLFDVAKNTAQSFNVAATAALEFSRQGLEMNEVLKRTNDALVLTRLTGLKAEEAVAGLTAAVNAFGEAGLTTTDIIDKLAAVDVKFAVSAEDLIKALERTGAVAIDAGVEIDSLIGLVAALQQTTARGGAVIGNGLKTIFTRIQRPESLKQLEKMDMLVKDLSGSVLSADRILLNIAKNFDNLTEAQQSNVVQFGAGIFQANIFRAALRDLAKEQSLQAKATNISAAASGNASVKNEQLNKTIAAMASQSVSALQELAAVMGELMVAPEIGSFLEFLKGGIEGLTDMLGGGEEHGSTFAKGLIRGIGNIITGPAAIAFGMVFVKLFVNIAKFARTSLKDVLGIVGQKDRIKQTEESIVKALSTNSDLQHGLNNLAGDHAAQELFVLKMIEAQTNAMREQQRLAKRLAIPVLRAGVQPDLTVKAGTGPVDLDGDGVSSAHGVLPSSASKERREASRGGYSAGAVDSMSIKGLGKVVYNKAETVKQFPGMQQPAIMPPRKSRAGSAYEDAFSQKHGFDPYASAGYIPNFATLSGDALRLNQSKMHLYANPREVKPGGDAVRNAMMELVNSGKPVTVSAATDKLLKGEGGSHTKAIKSVIRFIADQENGPKIFERDFKLTNLPWKGNKGEDASEDAVAKALNKGGAKYINTGKRPGAHGDKTFPVDLIGEGLDPVEVKSGEWQQPNILLKSMRLYSDDELMQFAERQYGATPEMLKGARMEKLGKSARLLQGKGLLGKDASLEEQHEAALKYGVAGGFVPNFMSGSAQRGTGTKILNEDIHGFFQDLGGATNWEEKYDLYNSTTWSSLMGLLGGKKDLMNNTLNRLLGNLSNNLAMSTDVSSVYGKLNVGKDGKGSNHLDADLAARLGRPEYLPDPLVEHLLPYKQKPFRRKQMGQWRTWFDNAKDSNGNSIYGMMTTRHQFRLGAQLKAAATMAATGKLTPTPSPRGQKLSTGGVAAWSNLWDLEAGAKIPEAIYGADLTKTIPTGNRLTYAGLTPPVNLAQLPPPKKGEPSPLDNFNQSLFEASITPFSPISKGARQPLSLAQLKTLHPGKDPGWKDFEDAVELKKVWGAQSSSSKAPLDFPEKNAEAKYGAKDQDLTPKKLVGKLLRNIVGSSKFKNRNNGSWDSDTGSSFKTPGKFDLGNLNLLGYMAKGLIPNFAAGFGGSLAGASKTAVQFGLAKMPRKNDLFMGAANVPSKIAKVSSKKGELHTEDGQAVRLDQLAHQIYSNRIAGASNNLFSRTSSNPVGMFNSLNKSGKAMIRDGYLEGGLLKHAEGNGFRLQKMDGKWHYERMGTPTQADDRLMNDMEIMSGQSFNYGLQQSAPKSGGFIDWDSRRPGYLAEGMIPNFAGDTMLYRGNSPRHQKAVPDTPNAPQFLFDEMMAAQTKEEFVKAVEALGMKHAMGKYSASYNQGIETATLGQIRGKEEVPMGQVHHAAYLYQRPIKGMTFEGGDPTLPSGFVSKSVDKGVAQNFARALEPGYEYDPKRMGQIHESRVPNSRIFDQEKIEKYIDRFGLDRVKKSFKDGMKNGTLKDVYLNLHKFKPKKHSTNPLDMFSPNAGEGERSIGMSGAGLSRDEFEITQAWSKNSPYYGEARGLVPNFIDVFHGTTMEGARGIIESGGVREGSPDPLSSRGLVDTLINRKGGVYWSPREDIPGFRGRTAIFSTNVSGRTPVHNGETITDAAGDLKINPETGHNLPLESQNKKGFKYWENNYNNFIARLDDPGGWSHFSFPEVRLNKPFVKDPKLVRPSLEEVMDEDPRAAASRKERESFSSRSRAGGFIPNFAKSFTLGMGNFKPEELSKHNRAEYIKQLQERMKWWAMRSSESGNPRFKGYADDLLSEISDVQSGADFMSLTHRKKHRMAAHSGLVPNFAKITSNKEFQGERLKQAIIKAYKSKYEFGEGSGISPKIVEQVLAQYRKQGGSGTAWSSGQIFGPMGAEINKREIDAFLSGGFIPNFNVQNGAQTLSGKNPLKEAISREAGAGIPRSQIKVEQSGQLRGPGNPMGLAVTNTRDEPLGVRQGINRARSMGIDPKTHGAGLGLIPNFADGGPKLKVTMLSAARLQEKKAILENAKALNESTSAIDKNRKKTDEDTKASSFGIEKLFFFQSAISGVNGFLEEFAEGASGVSKKLIGMTQAASDTTAAFIQSHTAATELLSMTGESERRIGLQDLGKKEGGFLSTISDARKGFTEGRAEGKGGGALGKLKSFGKGLAGAGKVLSRLAPIASQLYTGFTFANKAVGLFTANNETMTDLMSSGTKRAAKRLEELSTVTQEVTGSLEKLDAAEKNQEKIKELETKGVDRTIAEEKELMEIRKNQLKLGRTETDVLGRMAKLQNSGITAEKIAAEAFADLTRQGKNTTEALKGIEEVLHGASFAIEGMKSVQESINEMAGFDWWTDNEYSDLTKSQQTVVGGQLNVMNKGLYNSASTQDEADYIKRILSEAVQLDPVAGINEDAFQSKIAEAINSKRLNESTKGQMQGLMRLPETWDDEIDIAKAWQESAMKMAKEAEKQRKEQEEQTHSFENANRLNREFNAKLKIRGKVFSDTMSLEKKIQENLRQESDIRGKMLKDLGSISEAEFLRRQSQKDIADLEADYFRKVKTIYEGQITAQVKIMKDLMKQGQDAPEIMAMIKADNPMEAFREKVQGITTGKGATTMSPKALKAFTDIAPTIEGNKGADKLNYKYIETAIIEVADKFDLFGDESKDAFKEFIDSLGPLVGSKATQDIKQAILELHGETKQSLVNAKEMNKADKENLRVKNLDTLMASGTLAGAILKRDLMKKSVEIFGALVDTEMGLLENAKIARVNSFNALSMFLGNPAAGKKEVVLGSQDRSDAAVAASKAATRSVSEKELYDKFNKGSGASTMSQIESAEYQNMLKPILTDRQKVGTDLSKELFTAKRNAELQQLSKEELERAVQRNEIDQKKAESELLDARYKLQAMDEDEAILKTARARRANEEITLATELKNGLIEQQVRNENKKQLETIQKLTELKEEQAALAATENILIKARISQSGLGAQVARQRLESQANLGLDTRSAIMSAGQTGRSEDALSAAQKIQEYNRAAGKATEATDHLRVRMAELAVSEDMLATELIDVGIEGVKSGWQQVFKTIADGSKDADEAWKDFGLGIIKSILDKITEKNIEKIVGNLTYAFTGVGGPKDIEKQRSGIVDDTKKMDPLLNALQAKNAEAVEKELAKIKEANDEVIAKLKPMGNTVGEYTSMLGIMKDLSRTAFGELNTELRGFAKTISESTGYWAAAVKEFTIKAHEAAEEAIRPHREAREDREREAAFKKYNAAIPEGFEGPTQNEVAAPPTMVDKIKEEEALIKKRTALRAKYAPKSRPDDAPEEGSWLDLLGGTDPDKEVADKILKKLGITTQNALEPESWREFSRMTPELDAPFLGGTSATDLEIDKIALELADLKRQRSAKREEIGELRAPGEEVDRINAGIEGKEDIPSETIARIRELVQSQDSNKEALEAATASEAELKKQQYKLIEQIRALDTTQKADLKREREITDKLSKGETAVTAQKTLKELEAKLASTSAELKALPESLSKTPLLKMLQGASGTKFRSPADDTKAALLEADISGLKVAINDLTGVLQNLTASGNFLGGKIQKFNTGGFVNGPPGIDQVPAMLTKGEYVLPKESVQNLNGGTPDGAKNGIFDENTDSRLGQLVQGTTRAVVSYAITKAMEDKKPGEPPTFNASKLQSINIGSDISMNRNDPRMSGKFLAQDPVLEEYRGHLLELAQYKVDKKNAKYQEKLGILESIYGAVSSTGLAFATDMIKKPLNWAVNKTKAYASDKWGQAKGWASDNIGQPVKDWWSPPDPGNTGDSVTATLSRASGGPIPAMLTAGESYIPAPIAKRIGYNNLNHMNKTGQMPIIQGPGGIDNVGPMGLNEGDFIIRKSSTDKLLNNNPNMMRFAMQNPDGFKRGAQGYYEGGMVGGSELTMPASSLSPQRGSSSEMGSLASESNQETSRGGTSQGSTETTNNISINVSIDGSGAENATEEGGEGSYERERDLSLKIKGAVLDVIREEKRIGGELS